MLARSGRRVHWAREEDRFRTELELKVYLRGGDDELAVGSAVVVIAKARIARWEGLNKSGEQASTTFDCARARRRRGAPFMVRSFFFHANIQHDSGHSGCHSKTAQDASISSRTHFNSILNSPSHKAK